MCATDSSLLFAAELLPPNKTMDDKPQFPLDLEMRQLPMVRVTHSEDKDLYLRRIDTTSSHADIQAL